MRITRSLLLPAALDRCAEALLRPALMVHVAAPMVRFRFVRPAKEPRQWAPGEYEVALSLWGLLPLGRQVVRIEIVSLSPEQVEVRDNGGSALISKWDHHVRLERLPDGCRYTDQVDIEAGLLTPLIWAFASLFFQHRQRRLAALAKQDFAGLN